MAKTLRLLNVEDSKRDASLIQRHLTRTGYDLTFERVETAEAMRQALETQTWDVVLADYSMPQFSALQAFAVLQKSGLDLPFIIVSGTIGEEVAVAAMRIGVHDYLMKDNLARLAPAIEREMEEAANRRLRRQAEGEVERQRDRLNTIIATVPGVVWEAWGQPDDSTQQIDFISEYVETMLGYSTEEWLSTPNFWLSIVHPDDKAAAARRALAAFAGRRRATNEFRCIAKDGGVLLVESSSVTTVDDKGKPIGMRGVMIDISGRRRAEAASRDSEERYRLLFENNPDPIFVVDRESLKFLAVNEAAVLTYGYSREELLSMALADIWLPPVSALAEDQRMTCQHRRQDGTPIDVELTSHALILDGNPAWVVLAHDVTERIRLEERFRQAQKMEAIGQLAGGIAHDFNNILTVISGFSDLAIRRLPGGDPLQRDMEQILKAADRAAGLTRQLLAFSRKQVLLPTVLDLNAIVSDMEKMIRRLTGEDISLKTALQPGLGRIKADRGQIEQVIMNLVVNARDAMLQGGKLLIATEYANLSDKDARRDLSLPPGSYVLLSIADTGIGMGEQTKAHIFEPFFTTKELGKGTGLGLSTVYEIMQQSGGGISVTSELGGGTTFKVYLPLVEEAAQPDLQSMRLTTTAPLGTETILLTEDDDMVRSLAQRVLAMNGYQVLEAPNAREALLLCDRVRAIDLLITDMVMPEMNGPDLADRIVKTRPDMKVLFMSGHTDKAVVKQQFLDETMPFIQKPFSPSALLKVVRETLDQKR